MTQDTRKDRRVKIVSLNVRYKSATVDEFIDNHALDVSRGGIYIKTNNPFSPGTLLKFEIRLVSDQAVITGVGRVVWKRDAVHGTADRPPGMGVKFIKVDDPSRALIDKLVNTRTDAGKSFEAEPEAKTSPGSQRRVPTPAAVHSATRVGHPSASALRKGTMVGLGASAGSPNSPPRAGASGATGSPSAGIPRPGTTPPLGSAAAGGGASNTTLRPGGESQGATVRPGSDLSGASRRPDSEVSGATMRPSGVSAPPMHGGVSATESPRTPSNSVLPRGPSLPPRPGPTTGSNMFPKRPTSSIPPKGEATVMKQAAELLEEALREAGGSMDDVGTNPLFSGGGSAEPAPVVGVAATAAEQAGGESAKSIDRSEAPPQDEAANARAMVAAIAPGPVQRRRPDVLTPPREPAADRALLAEKLQAAKQIPSLQAAIDEDEATAAGSRRKKGGAAKWILLFAAALGAAGYAFRVQIKGAIAQLEKTYASSASPPIAATPPTSIPSASPPAAPPSAIPEPALSASAATAVAPESSASSSAAGPAGSASAAASSTPPPRGGSPSTARPATPPAAYAAAARPRPAAAPTATVAPTAPESNAASTSAGPSKEPETETPPAATAAPPDPTASPSSGSSVGTPPSTSRSSGRSAEENNPY